MFTKVTTWITLGMSLATVLYSTWPRTVASTIESKAAFLSHQSHWVDSVMTGTDPGMLSSQRLALWIDGKDSLPDPVALTSLVNEIQPGSMWIQDLNQSALSSYLKSIHRHSEIVPMIGTLPGKEAGEIPAVPGGLALAGLGTYSGLAGLSSRIAESATEMGISAVGVPALMGSQTGQAEVTQYPGMEVAHLLAKEEKLTILWEADDFSDILTADSTDRTQLLEPYQIWTRVPLAGWVLTEPHHEYQELQMSQSVDLLRNTIGFDGLILGTLREHATPQATKAAIKRMLVSGVDILLLSPDELALANQLHQTMLNTRELSAQTVAASVEPILKAKSWTGRQTVDSLDQSVDIALKWEFQSILEKSVSVLQNHDGVLPVTSLPSRTVHVVEMGSESPEFLEMLRRYFPVSASKGFDHDPWFAMSSIRLKRYDPLILVFGASFPFEESGKLWQQIRQLGESTPIVVVNLGPAYRMDGLPENVTLVQGFDSGTIGQSVAAQVIAGGIPTIGRFPMVLSEQLQAGQESPTDKIRLAFGPAEAAGLDSEILSRIDTIAWEGIADLAMPGTQILVARKGRVIYNQAHGYHTYLRQRGVYSTDLYDVASMTKVMATTLAAMSMVERGKLDLDATARSYFRNPYIWEDSSSWTDTLFLGALASSSPDTTLGLTRGQKPSVQGDTTFLPGDSILVIRHQASGRIRRPAPALSPTITELLTHTSGLPAGINLRPFYRGRSTWNRNKQYFSVRPDSLHTIPVARDLYLRTDMQDSIWAATMALRRQDSAGYRYSDANLILVQRVIDSLNQESLDRYLERTWYHPLGLQHTTFRPSNDFELDRLVPTEHDKRYRQQTLQGHVHDPTAALLGGVAGNAGLFSTAEDLAIIGQMWLQEGRYGGTEWLSPETVEEFTQRQAGHRGLGFDKPPYSGDYLIAPSASKNSFGHTGFTGTLIWMDPDEELVFIFLSNRVHPRANNWQLNQMRIRQRAHEVVYEAIREAQGEEMMATIQ